MGRPQKLTPIEKSSLYSEFLQGVKKESLAVKYSVSMRTVDRIIGEERRKTENE